MVWDAQLGRRLCDCMAHGMKNAVKHAQRTQEKQSIDTDQTVVPCSSNDGLQTESDGRRPTRQPSCSP